VPTPEEIRRIEAENPFADIEIEVKQGDRLSNLKDQDSYSYEVAVIFIGGENSKDLEAKYERILDQLPLELEPITDQ
jgi:hypothetical protein